MPTEVAPWATSPDPYTLQNKPPPQKKQQKRNKKQIRRVWGQVRWPFGPPHLTLKPSKKNTKKTKKKETKKKTKNRKTKKYAKIPKKAFQLSVILFFFGVDVQIFPFLTTWPKKPAPKNTKNIGVQQPIFGKQFCLTKQPFLDKKPNPEIPVIVFFSFIFSFNNKNTKISWNPYFYSVLANLNKR